MTLLHEICRCHDARCPERTKCLRWLTKDVHGEWAVHSPSLRGDVPEGEPCPHRIPAKEER